ncbi:MAG: alpha-hydroxyketone-type quorum-sensing autoinducer synthase [Methyloligellaceae bacterium]
MTKKLQQSNIRHIYSRSTRDPDFLYDKVDTYYQKRVKEEFQGTHPLKGSSPGPNSVLMRSNDYLCLSGDKRILKAKIRALRKLGHGDSASRIWGYHSQDLMREFELRMAGLMKAEDGVLCNSGYSANVGLIQAFATPETPVYIDMLAHMSLWEGISSAKAEAKPFRHNDPNHLERQVKKYGPGFIAVDALYSTDGDIAPLEEIVQISEKYGCVLIVDETHSFGAQGPNGAGIVVQKKLADRVHFRTVGLSKAVASRGGMVLCSKRNAEFFGYEAFPNIFSTSVLEHEVVGYNAVLDILQSDDWRPKRLHKNHAFLKKNLSALGYNVESSKTQIISLEPGEILKTIKLRQVLEENDIFGSVFLSPAVPDKRSLIRFTVNCGLSTKQLHYVIDVCKNIREEVKMEEWRSTRRLNRYIKSNAA